MESTLFKNGIPYVKKNTVWTPIKVPESNIFNHSLKPLEFESKSNGFLTEKGIIKLSWALHLYNDQRYETARYFFLKRGRITEQVNISSKIPNFTVFMPERFMIEQMLLYCQKTDKMLFFAHNHPSGNIMPSESDIQLTRYLNNFFVDYNSTPRFAGHLIIGKDYTGYFNAEKNDWSFIDGQNETFTTIKPIEQFSDVFKENYHGMPQVMGELAPYVIDDFHRAVNQNIDWDTKNYIPAYYLNSMAYIQGIEYIPQENFWDKPHSYTKKILQESAVKTGCSSVVFFIPSEDNQLFSQVKYFAQKTGMVANICMPTPNGFQTLPEYFRGTIFKNDAQNMIYIAKTFDLDTNKKDHYARTLSQNDYTITR